MPSYERNDFMQPIQTQLYRLQPGEIAPADLIPL